MKGLVNMTEWKINKITKIKQIKKKAMVRLYVNQIRKDNLLGSNSNRYVKDWLEKRKIVVFYDGNKAYVNMLDFEMEYEKQMIAYLRKKYGRQWEEYYKCYTTGNSHALRIMDEENKSPSYDQKYVLHLNPVSDAGKDFINKLQR